MDSTANDPMLAAIRRRTFLGRSAAGLGSLALASLLDPSLLRAGDTKGDNSRSRQPGRYPGAGHQRRSAAGGPGLWVKDSARSLEPVGFS